MGFSTSSCFTHILSEQICPIFDQERADITIENANVSDPYVQQFLEDARARHGSASDGGYVGFWQQRRGKAGIVK